MAVTIGGNVVIIAAAVAAGFAWAARCRKWEAEEDAWAEEEGYLS